MSTTTCPPEGPQLAAFLRRAYPESLGEYSAASPDMSSIRIDDRQSSDVSLDFCSIEVRIPNDGKLCFTLHLKNLPLDDRVEELIDSKGGEITGEYPNLQVEIPLRIADVVFLRKLASRINVVVGRGRTYSIPNWKWVCRQTVAALTRLADRIIEYRRLRRKTPWLLPAVPREADAQNPTTPGSTKQNTQAMAANTSEVEGEVDLFVFLGIE